MPQKQMCSSRRRRKNSTSPCLNSYQLQGTALEAEELWERAGQLSQSPAAWEGKKLHTEASAKTQDPSRSQSRRPAVRCQMKGRHRDRRHRGRVWRGTYKTQVAPREKLLRLTPAGDTPNHLDPRHESFLPTCLSAATNPALFIPCPMDVGPACLSPRVPVGSSAFTLDYNRAARSLRLDTCC